MVINENFKNNENCELFSQDHNEHKLNLKDAAELHKITKNNSAASYAAYDFDRFT